MFVFGVLMSPSHPSPSAAWVVPAELSDEFESVEVSDSLVSDVLSVVSVVASAVVAVAESVEVDSAVVVSLVVVSLVNALASKLPIRLLASTPPSAVTANTPVTINGFARASAIGFAPSWLCPGFLPRVCLRL